ncbi:MAG: Na+/H+ antiporter NhaC family protein [Planctomycetota bacterium]
MTDLTAEPKPLLKMPPALVIVSIIVALAAIATLIVPRGEYERVTKSFGNYVLHEVQEGDTRETIAAATGLEIAEDLALLDHATAQPLAELVAGVQVRVPRGDGLTREAVIPDSYPVPGSEAKSSLADETQSAFANAALSPIKGFEKRAEIIAFVFLLGGAFGIMLATGALDRTLTWAVVAMGDGKTKWLVVPVSMTLFSLGGAVFGLGESTIAFVLITVPLAIRLGFDTITGICVCYLASQIGFGGAFFNPFTVGIAQAIAEVPYLSGNGVRYVTWAIVTAVGIAFVQWHAARVHRDPWKSPTFALDEIHRAKLGDTADLKAQRPGFSDWGVIACVLGSVLLTAYGVQQFNWWIPEMAACFVVLGLVAGFIARFSLTKMVDEFVDGAKLMVEPCLIIAVSAGIVFVLQEGRVLDTILYAAAQPLEAMGPSVAAVAMMGMQAFINFFVPSGSGQAAMTMPITAPLCDLIDVERQVGVLAYQFGDGFGNMIIPTSAVLMGVLGVARVDWSVWLKWVWPLVLGLYIIGAVVLLIATNGPASWLQ